MNIDRIDEAAGTVKTAARAMNWLQQYGLARVDSSIDVRVDLVFAQACPGADDVAQLAKELLRQENRDLARRLYDYAQKKLAEAEAAIRAEVSEKGTDNG